MARHCDKFPEPFYWKIEIEQDDSEDDGYLEATERIDLHCEENYPRILGSFYRD